MSDSVYRVTQVIGVSPDSWEAATRNAVERPPARFAACGSQRSCART
jgi:flavin-binding protein dodecin